MWPDFWIPMVNEEQIDGYDYLDKRFNHGIQRARPAQARCHSAAGSGESEFRRPSTGRRVSSHR